MREPRERPDEFAPGASEPPRLPEGGLTRRRFLALCGATAALSAATGCSADRGAVVPATQDPEGYVPGVAERFASAFDEGEEVHPVLVKTREGRPIHVEGNDLSPEAAGRTSLRAVADLLSLYDPERLTAPLLAGKPAAWAEALGRCAAALADAAKTGGKVLLVCGASASPARAKLLAELDAALPGLVRVVHEPAASPAPRAADIACHGTARRAAQRMERARVIVAFEPDLLGGHRPAETAGFAARRPRHPDDPEMNRLYVFEGAHSIAGGAADHRLPLRPSRAAHLAFALARSLAKAGIPLPEGLSSAALEPFDLAVVAARENLPLPLLESLLADLLRARSRALAHCGPSLPYAAQVATRLLNAMLSAEGETLDASRAVEPAALPDPAALRAALESARTGGFAVALFDRVNPGYDFPDRALFRAALERIPTRIALARAADETSRACDVVLPVHHWLESWDDFLPALDRLVLRQPAISPLYDTRQAEEILLGFARSLGRPLPDTWHEFLKARLRDEVAKDAPAGFDAFLRAALHDGFALLPCAAPPPPRPFAGRAAAEVASSLAAEPAAPADSFELLLLPSHALHDGRYAGNGWLQEMPDPVTKLTWGNVLSLSPRDGKRLGVTDGDLLELSAGGVSAVFPAHLQPGQAPGVVATRFGGGRETGAKASGIGVNAYPFVASDPRSPHLRAGVTLRRAGGRVELPHTQEHFRLGDRDLVRRYDLPADGPALRGPKPKPHPPTASLYPPLEFPEHKWGMAIDLAACVGCGACVIACQSENNIPCVGPEQVLVGREMHWMRVDRYYEGDEAAPRTLHLPVLCQQCETAPCETVCPVYATNHSPDGLNQMAYNRCVGTRYCGNNCPYRVRRFNFLQYSTAHADPERLVYNPEVTVRPRGVMEKCTFCVQRIQDARARAKAEGRRIREGEIVPACAAACPSRAIVFGDLRDPGSAVSVASADRRGFRVLEELGVKPSVTYLARLVNGAGTKG